LEDECVDILLNHDVVMKRLLDGLYHHNHHNPHPLLPNTIMEALKKQIHRKQDELNEMMKDIHMKVKDFIDLVDFVYEKEYISSIGKIFRSIPSSIIEFEYECV
jgi:hypothetical protein